jgi:hypothetical protein
MAGDAIEKNESPKGIRSFVRDQVNHWPARGRVYGSYGSNKIHLHRLVLTEQGFHLFLHRYSISDSLAMSKQYSLCTYFD